MNISVEQIENAVLHYLENYKSISENSFSKLILFGVKANDILRYLQNSQVTERWGEEFTDAVYLAIERIYEKYLIPFPVIPELTEIDIFISKMLIKRGWMVLGGTNFFFSPVEMRHVIKYLQRDKEIYTWNSYFIKQIQMEYIRVIEHLAGAPR